MSGNLSAPAPHFAALVRNDRGGLELRRFHTSADAAGAAADREMVSRVRSAGPGIPSHQLARELGVSAKTIRRRWEKGDLPGIAHGERTLLIPHDAVRLVKIHGLLGYAHRRAAGLL